MTRFLRRLFWCRRGEHRDALEMKHVPLVGPLFARVVMYVWYWHCVDCGARRWYADSDNIGEERKAGRLA